MVKVDPLLAERENEIIKKVIVETLLFLNTDDSQGELLILLMVDNTYG